MTSRWFWRVGVRENECGEGLGLPRFGSILDHGMSLHLDVSSLPGVEDEDLGQRLCSLQCGSGVNPQILGVGWTKGTSELLRFGAGASSRLH